MRSAEQSESYFVAIHIPGLQFKIIGHVFRGSGQSSGDKLRGIVGIDNLQGGLQSIGGGGRINDPEADGLPGCDIFILRCTAEQTVCGNIQPVRFLQSGERKRVAVLIAGGQLKTKECILGGGRDYITAK